MRSISFFIPGDIRGKGRPRSRVCGKPGSKQFVQVYSQKEDVHYENLVKLTFMNAAQKDGWKMVEQGVPVKAEFTCMFERPASMKTKRNINIKYAMKKPDFDNIEKIICDPLNKIAYYDDSQIVSATIDKIFADDNPPGVIVTFRVMDPEGGNLLC